MSNQQGLQTPRRPTFNIFDDDAEPTPVDNTQNPCFTFTPCTRLSRMTINSQSNGSRMRAVQYQLPVTSFNDKLMQVIREEKEEQDAKAATTPSSNSSHPNLDMFLNADKISMMDKSSKDFSFSEDEESDEGDFFSSSLCPMSSPERPVNRKSIFDDEPMHQQSPPVKTNKFKRSIFDEDDDDDEEEEDQEQDINNNEFGDFYDPSSAWLSCIYQDNANISNNIFRDDEDEDDEENEDDNENRPPRHWHSRQQYEKKIRRTSPQEEENAVQDRIPLREINVEDYYSDSEDLPVKKKMVLSSRKPHKLRFMRALSPPKYMSKHKGKETLNDSTSTLSTSSAVTSFL